jgi:hypothetical protein
VGGIYDSGGLGAPEQIAKPVLSDHGRVRGVREEYREPRGKAQAILGATVSDQPRDREYWDGGDADIILSRHAGRY